MKRSLRLDGQEDQQRACLVGHEAGDRFAIQGDAGWSEQIERKLGYVRPLPLPQLERLKPDRHPVGIRAVIDGAIYVADGVQADVDRILNREHHVPGSESALAVRAIESIHTTTNPLRPQKGSDGIR